MKTKRKTWLWASMLAAALCFPAFSACGDDDETPESPTPPPGQNDDDADGDGDIHGSATMSVAAQKQKLQDVGLELTSKFQAEDFRYFYDLAEHVDGTLCEDYNTQAVEDWFDNCLDNITSFIREEEYTEFWGWHYVNSYNKRLYAASAFTGHFKAENGRWVHTAANDLQFTFRDQTNATCVLKLTTSGNKKTVYVGNTSDYDWVWSGDYATEYADIYENRLSVPENLTLTLVQNGTTRFSVTVKTDLSSMSSEEFDLSRDAYSASAVVRIDSYEWNVSRAAYRAGGMAALSATMGKNGETLLTTAATAENCRIDTEGDASTVAAINLSFDILGAVQIKGSVSNGKQLVDYLERAADNDDNEGNYKSWISQANDLLSLGVYYDKKNTCQARVKLAPFCDRGYWGDEWYAEPVIYFEADGSSMSTFDTFFNEDDFRRLADKVEQLVRDFEEMLGMGDD